MSRAPLFAAVCAVAWVTPPPLACAQVFTEIPTLAADAPLTLRPAPRARRLARRVARTLSLRLDVPVTVGQDAPPEVLEAVPSGHAAIAREDDEVRLVLAGPQGQVFHTRVVVAHLRPAAVVRSVALALEELHDMAVDGPPPGRASRRTVTMHSRREITWVYIEATDGLFGPRRRLEATAKPFVSVGFLGGGSTERLTAQLAPRVALGLCQTFWCLLLEGDLPLVPESSTACDGREVQYRPVTLAMRLLMRPLIEDRFSMAFGLGILTRFGTASLVGVDASRLTTNFGLRGTLEGAYRIAGPFEVALEVGLDAHTSPAILTRLPRPAPGTFGCPPGAEHILVEDIITVFAVLAIRLRPT